jgi:lambda family phage portal protein
MGFLDFFRRRETPAQRADWLQGALRNATGSVQQQQVALLRQSQRSFTAAETPAWVDSWPTTAGPINDDLSRQLPTLRARSRAAARNDEWAIGYMLRLDDNVLGETGMTLQMRLKRGDGTADIRTNERIEAAWADWGRAAEITGLTWRDVESLALAAGPEDGELLYRYRIGAGKYRIQIQLLDPALIDVNLRRDWGGNRVRMGIEIDNDGKPVAYWLKAVKAGEDATAMAIGPHVRVPASEIRHRFLRRHVGQLRGYPWLSGGARRLWMLHDFEEAAAVASSNAAKRQGFFKSGDGEAPAGFADVIVSGVLEAAKAQGKVLTPDEIQQITAAAEKYNTTMPGQFDTLPHGYDFAPFESKWPDVSADGYVKQQLRGWAAARGISYVTLGNDLEGVNYSSANVGIVGEREHFKRLQGILRQWLHEDVFQTVLPYLVMATAGLSPARVETYQSAAKFQGRRWAHVDPTKTANANDTNLKNQLTSRRRVILERGEDPDEVFAEIDEETERFGAPGGNASKPEPADTEDPKEGEEGDDKPGNDAAKFLA